MTKEIKFNYLKNSRELDDIIAGLQNPMSDIDESIKSYEKGLKIIKEIEDYLNTAENKIKKLKK